MNRVIVSWLSVCLVAGSLTADGWDPEDDTFDPTIPSVNVGNATWLGDPSPFVYLPKNRTGYTYVQATDWEGFDPSVQISLMVPIEGAEKTPPGAGMLMLNKSQSADFIKALTDATQSELPVDAKRIEIETAMQDANWALNVAADQGKRFLQLENKRDDKLETYRFTINASKKLIGAVKHSLKKLKSKSGE